MLVFYSLYYIIFFVSFQPLTCASSLDYSTLNDVLFAFELVLDTSGTPPVEEEFLGSTLRGVIGDSTLLTNLSVGGITIESQGNDTVYELI